MWLNLLCITFPALYSIANLKGAKVVEVWDSLGEGGGWNLRFGRGFNDWELDTVQDFIAIVQNKKIAPTVEDRLVWKRSTDGTYSVKSCFDLLEGESCSLAPSKLFWNSNVLSKVGFFAWEVWWDKVLTMNQLKRRGFPPTLWRDRRGSAPPPNQGTKNRIYRRNIGYRPVPI